MTKRSPSLRRNVAFLVLAANLVALAACSGTTGSTAMAPTLDRNNKRAATPYITVDDTSCDTSSCANEITGINDSRDIVGNYSTCTSSSANPCNGANWSCNPTGPSGGSPCHPCPLYGGANTWHSYTSIYNGGYSSFADVQFPDAPKGQYMYAISDRIPIQLNVGASPPPAIEVGCINPFAGSNGEEKGFWPLLNNNGLWSVHDLGPGTGCKSTTTVSPKIDDNTAELLGYDLTNTATKTAVGFYSNPKCAFEAGEIQAGDDWKPLTVSLPKFSAKNVMAIGITKSNGNLGSGDIVGTATSSLSTSGKAGYQVAWYSRSKNPAPYSFTGSTATVFTGIAYVGAGAVGPTIVGWYTLPPHGTNLATTHGLVATPPTTSSGTYIVSTIDIGAGLTVINGINTLGDICGWYTDSSGTYHGFVWLGRAATPLRERHGHHSLTNHRGPQVSVVAVPVQQARAVH